MVSEQYIKENQAFIFELDDVLYPQKDYLLQVYYLFAQFIEYGEQISAGEILKHMQHIYLTEGPDEIFEKTARHFNIPAKYRVNFDLLHHSARLPLKLLIFNELLNFLQEIVVERKPIFLFTDGDPGRQLNKIKQIEWHGLETYLTVYFAAETESKPSGKGLELIVDKHHLNKENVLFIGKTDADRLCAKNTGIDFLQVDELLLV